MNVILHLLARLSKLNISKTREDALVN